MQLEMIERHGQGGAAKDPVLFVHGACHSAACWDNFMEYFSRGGRDCYAFSFRGHGKSEGRERIDEFGLDDYVDDLAWAIDSLPSRPVVVAHSLGGMVLERYMGQHPDRIGKAVLLCSMLPDGTSMGYQVKMLLRHFGPTKVMMDVNSGKKVPIDRLAGSVLFSGRMTPELLAPYAAEIIAESKKVSADQARPATDNWDVGMDVSVVGCTGDWMFPDQTGNAAKYGVQPVMVQGLCHDAMIDPDWRRAAETVEKAIAG